MLVKPITYTDYNGRERTEKFYFNLTKAELWDMEFGETGGMRNLIQLMLEKQDLPKIIKEVKRFILAAYGEKSLDGRRFIKSEELSEAFKQTPAFSALYMELISDGATAADFINGLMPEDMAAQMEEKTEDAPIAPVVSLPVSQEKPTEPADAGLLKSN